VVGGSVEEVLVPFREGVTRDGVPVTTKFRSTWLSSSMRALRERGLRERYLALLPPADRETIGSLVVGVWLPVSVAIAHYDACEALGLTEIDMLALGADVSRHAQGSVLSVAVTVAKGAGVTPWTIITRYPGIWSRTWIGGGCSVLKLGPKDARLEIGGWPCARTRYCRVAMRGVLRGLAQSFSRQAYVTEVPRMCTALTLAYEIRWA
jgi:hypothetical protein